MKKVIEKVQKYSTKKNAIYKEVVGIGLVYLGFGMGTLAERLLVGPVSAQVKGLPP